MTRSRLSAGFGDACGGRDARGIEPSLVDQAVRPGPSESPVAGVVAQIGRAEGAVAVLRLGALVEQLEIDPARFHRHAEEHFALAEVIEAALDLGARHMQAGMHVAVKEARRGLERLARRDHRVVTPVTLVDERAWRARQLCRRLFDQAVAPVVVPAVLLRRRKQPVHHGRCTRVVRAVVRADHAQHSLGRKVFREVRVRPRVRCVRLRLRIEPLQLLLGLRELPVADALKGDAAVRGPERHNLVDALVGAAPERRKRHLDQLADDKPPIEWAMMLTGGFSPGPLSSTRQVAHEVDQPHQRIAVQLEGALVQVVVPEHPQASRGSSGVVISSSAVPGSITTRWPEKYAGFRALSGSGNSASSRTGLA